MGAPRKSKTVLKALEILEELAKSEEGISNKDLSRRLNLHPSTSYRLLNTMVGKGYVSKHDGLYRMGYKILQLKCVTNHNASLRHRARPLLADLESRTGFTTNLAVRDRLCAIPIEIINGSRELVVNNNLGKPVPLHATSVGKCLLAFLPEDEQEIVVKQLELERYTPNTITDRHELLRELEITRERGYGIDDEEFVTGIRCIGAPIFNKGGGVVAALSISGLTSQIQSEVTGNLAIYVMETANEISSKFTQAAISS